LIFIIYDHCPLVPGTIWVFTSYFSYIFDLCFRYFTLIWSWSIVILTCRISSLETTAPETIPKKIATFAQHNHKKLSSPKRLSSHQIFVEPMIGTENIRLAVNKHDWLEVMAFTCINYIKRGMVNELYKGNPILLENRPY